MKKRIVVFLIVVIISLSVVFTACNKDVYTDPSTGNEYILVTDENGEKVLNDDGELLVYSTDEDGKKIKDEDGNYVTEVHGFIGQIENDGVIEDYAYYFTLPDGWKAVNDRGEFENKSKGLELEIGIQKDTLNDYYTISKRIFDELDIAKARGDIEEAAEYSWNEYDYKTVSSKVYVFSLKLDDSAQYTMFFEQNNNLYVLNLKGQSKMDLEEGRNELLGMLDCFEFKPYTYYEDLSDSVTLYDQSTTTAE